LTLSKILAKSKEFLQTKNDIAEGKLSHAYIITAPDKLLGREFFLLVARQIMYKYGFLSAELVDYKIELGVHPDVKLLGGEEKILTQSVEDVVADVFQKGLEADYKVYLLDAYTYPIEARAQNKLLKVYEEPPTGVSLFILTPSESALLNTINSRASKIVISPLSTESIMEYLLSQAIPEDIARSCARLSGGSPEVALNFAKDKERYLHIVAECVRILRDCTHTSKVIEFLGSQAFSKDNFSTSLYFLEIIFQDLAHKLTSNQYLARTEEFGIDEIAGFQLGSLASAIRAVHNARLAIASNIQADSVAETMLFNILEAKYKWQ